MKVFRLKELDMFRRISNGTIFILKDTRSFQNVYVFATILLNKSEEVQKAVLT